MPIWADPARGERVRLLADDDLTLLGMFVSPPSARPTAADLRAVPGTDLERFAAVAVRDMPGVRVTTQPAEAAALVAAGATLDRTLVHMVRRGLQGPSGPAEREAQGGAAAREDQGPNLPAEKESEGPPPLRWAAPHLAAELDLVGVEAADLHELAVVQRLAYGPGHPDHEAVTLAQASGTLEALLAGDLRGPVYADASSLVRDDDGRTVACLVATQWEGIGEEWPGGPWVAELFKVPGGPPGLGRSLLERAVAVCALDGHDAVGLSVNATNPARRLCDDLGFRDAFSRVSLDLPGAWPAPG